MPMTETAPGSIPFPHDAARTAIVLMYHQPGLIADRVLPPTPPLGSSKFEYSRYKLEDAFTIPDTRLGRKSEPNQVEFEGERITDSTEHYGLLDLVPQEDVDTALRTRASRPEWIDPRDVAAIKMRRHLRLAREKRVADLVFSADNYAAGYKATLAGNSQWSHADSDPWVNLQAALDKPILRPNIVVFGRPAWSKFRTNKKVLLALRRSEENAAGLAMRQEVADALEVDEVIVGEPRINTAKEGQAVVLSAAWGKSCACLYRGAYSSSTRPGGKPGSEGADDLMSDGQMETFGFTAVYEPLAVSSRFNQGRGIKGVHEIQVKESCKEVIAASQFGYLLSSVVA